MWVLTCNGVPLDGESEIRQQVQPLLQEPTREDEIVSDLLERLVRDNPSEGLDRWLHLEPAIYGSFDFVPPPSDYQLPVDLAHTPVDTALAKVAACGLLQGFEENLRFVGETPILTINPANPPTLEQSGEIVRRIFDIKDAANRLDEFTHWQMGSIMDALETHYGDRFSVSQICEITEENYNFFMTTMNTFRAFRDRRYKLSFTHHKEAYFSRLSPEEMHGVLHISERVGIGTIAQRKLIKFVKLAGLQAITEEDMASKEALMTKVESIRDLRKNFVFRVGQNWFHFRGARTALPQEALDVICPDDWTLLPSAAAQAAHKLDTWGEAE